VASFWGGSFGGVRSAYPGPVTRPTLQLPYTSLACDGCDGCRVVCLDLVWEAAEVQGRWDFRATLHPPRRPEV
jgi:hypothetical protein